MTGRSCDRDLQLGAEEVEATPSPSRNDKSRGIQSRRDTRWLLYRVHRKLNLTEADPLPRMKERDHLFEGERETRVVLALN
jgi:hypothetical protein